MREHFCDGRKVGRLTMLVILSLSLISSFVAPGMTLAQDPGLQGPTDPAEMETFFDGMMLSNMDAEHIAGVTVAIVKDGETFFSKGYGYADVEKQIPVDAETTVFRIASVSKLFAWTAVMQLAEQGKLNLDADVNTYLDFEIPATYPEPITMKHLLTHTAGFEECSYGISAASAETLAPLGVWLKTHLPARVLPAGRFTSYSNYGASLAAYIVERISGMSYDAYIEQYILQPLGMTHTTSRQPLPAALTADLAQGYRFVAGRYAPQDFEWMNDAPAGAMGASAEDMARFMIAHLQDGRYAEARILKEETAQQMHTRLFIHDERLSNGLAYGFYEMNWGGQRIIGHGGDIDSYHSHLALLLDENVGFFSLV